MRNGNTNKISNEIYDYKKGKQGVDGTIQFQILLDDVTYRRYQSQFEQLVDKGHNDGMPPKEWLQGSKSYFNK